MVLWCFCFGYDALSLARCKTAGIDGIIIPDLPFEEKEEARRPAQRYDIDVISLIALTSDQRIRLIASNVGAGLEDRSHSRRGNSGKRCRKNNRRAWCRCGTVYL